MKRFELLENDDGDAELMPCDTGRYVWLKDVEEERERVREEINELAKVIRNTVPGLREMGWPITAELLEGLAKKAEAVQG